MIRTELLDDRCCGCGTSLERAVRYERKDVVYESGEYAGEGVDVAAFCGCGATTTIAFSVSPSGAT